MTVYPMLYFESETLARLCPFGFACVLLQEIVALTARTSWFRRHHHNIHGLAIHADIRLYSLFVSQSSICVRTCPCDP